jgi:hypothetical protein
MISRNNGKPRSRQYPEDRWAGLLDCRNLSSGQRDQATGWPTLVDSASRAWIVPAVIGSPKKWPCPS